MRRWGRRSAGRKGIAGGAARRGNAEVASSLGVFAWRQRPPSPASCREGLRRPQNAKKSSHEAMDSTATMHELSATRCSEPPPSLSLRSADQAIDVTKILARFGRATLPAYQGKGRKPVRGALVRPLPRMYKGHTIAATPPDRHDTWQLHLGSTSLSLHAAFWDNLA